MPSDFEGGGGTVMWRFAVAHTWQGEALADDEVATVAVSAGGIEVDAPLFGVDPRPEGQGHHGRLWEYEVVEVFLGRGPGRDAPYVEVEVGPWGHWLVLAFDGYRRPGVGSAPAVTGCAVERYERDGRRRWRARLELAGWSEAVAGAAVGNAYAIHTEPGGGRRHCAWRCPDDGRRPDFHAAEVWGRLGRGALRYPAV